MMTARTSRSAESIKQPRVSDTLGVDAVNINAAELQMEEVKLCPQGFGESWSVNISCRSLVCLGSAMCWVTSFTWGQQPLVMSRTAMSKLQEWLGEVGNRKKKNDNAIIQKHWPFRGNYYAAITYPLNILPLSFLNEFTSFRRYIL